MEIISKANGHFRLNEDVSNISMILSSSSSSSSSACDQDDDKLSQGDDQSSMIKHEAFNSNFYANECATSDHKALSLLRDAEDSHATKNIAQPLNKQMGFDKSKPSAKSGIEKEETDVYCICKRSSSSSVDEAEDMMIECDACKDWLHGK